jgi:hypothetical protein
LAWNRAIADRLATTELECLATAWRPLDDDADAQRLADCALVLARLEQHYRTSIYARQSTIPEPGNGADGGLEGVIAAAEISHASREDRVALVKAALEDNQDLYAARPLYVNPTFVLSSALGGADADLVAAGLLIDFKATAQRSVIRSVEIYQLLGYALADLTDSYGIHSVGISALRWRSWMTWPVADLLEAMSRKDRSLSEWRERFAAILPQGRVERALARHAAKNTGTALRGRSDTPAVARQGPASRGGRDEHAVTGARGDRQSHSAARLPRWSMSVRGTTRAWALFRQAQAVRWSRALHGPVRA